MSIISALTGDLAKELASVRRDLGAARQETAALVQELAAVRAQSNVDSRTLREAIDLTDRRIAEIVMTIDVLRRDLLASREIVLREAATLIAAQDTTRALEMLDHGAAIERTSQHIERQSREAAITQSAVLSLQAQVQNLEKIQSHAVARVSARPTPALPPPRPTSVSSRNGTPMNMDRHTFGNVVTMK
jgi:hypothetical protein